jgi:hypothetical protein
VLHTRCLQSHFSAASFSDLFLCSTNREFLFIQTLRVAFNCVTQPVGIEQELPR